MSKTLNEFAGSDDGELLAAFAERARLRAAYDASPAGSRERDSIVAALNRLERHIMVNVPARSLRGCHLKAELGYTIAHGNNASAPADDEPSFEEPLLWEVLQWLRSITGDKYQLTQV